MCIIVRSLRVVNSTNANVKLEQSFLVMEGSVCDWVNLKWRVDSYDPTVYNVTDKATQPDVIGYAIAASTEAIHVISILII